MTVPVVDRGPFRNGAHWDLTFAAAQALGFRYTDVIGAVRLREPAPAR
jgi:rare lipoprotein A (peptidoglycan hydrolase)